MPRRAAALQKIETSSEFPIGTIGNFHFRLHSLNDMKEQLSICVTWALTGFQQAFPGFRAISVVSPPGRIGLLDEARDGRHAAVLPFVAIP
jgi:hypothetical protein